MDRPPVYLSRTWHDPVPRGLTILPANALDSLRRLNGSVPANLDAEPLVIAFANEALVAVAPADIEADLFHPHRTYASRKWVREEYQRFVQWCRENGWLEADEAVASPPADQGGDPAAEKDWEKPQADYSPVPPEAPPAPQPAPAPAPKPLNRAQRRQAKQQPTQEPVAG